MSNSVKERMRDNIYSEFKNMGGDELDTIVSFIKNKGRFQKIGNYFVFRLFNAVTDREEVFVGNILFNDYISKLLVRTYDDLEKYKGKMGLVYNDLENFYYVVEEEEFDRKTLKELEDDFRDYFANNLEELFFKDEDLSKGIYGNFRNLMLGQGANYISLPLTILPSFFQEEFKNNFAVNLDFFPNKEQISMMALYWAATGSEMQSYKKFFIKELTNFKNQIKEVSHILNSENKVKVNKLREINVKLSKQEGLLNLIEDLYLIYFEKEGNLDELKLTSLKTSALKDNLEEVPSSLSSAISDKIIQANNLLKNSRYLDLFKEIKSLKKKMRAKKYSLLKDVLEKNVEDIENELNKVNEGINFKYSDDYQFNGFSNFKKQLVRNKEISYQKDKLINISKEKYIKELLSNININSVNEQAANDNNKCYICWSNSRNVVSKNLLTGGKEEKFTNDNNTTINNICLNCSIYLWLKLKLLGTYFSGNVFPEKRNIVFFYGYMEEEKLNQINGVLNSLYYCTTQPSVYTYEVIETALEDLNEEVKEELEAEDLLDDLIESDQKDEKSKEKKGKVPPTIRDWYRQGRRTDKINSHVFGVGSGKNKLYTFILPYALNRSDEVQEKFSQNRVAVYSMLSFLAKLTGVDGNFYYLSTPKLTDELEEDNVFYYKDEKKEKTLEEYELLTEVAWDLVNERCSRFRGNRERLFIMRLKLARKLEDLPLITLAKVYRVLVDDDNDDPLYKNLSNIRDEEVGVNNLFPLIKISNGIRETNKTRKGGVKFMGQEIDTHKLKEFTDDLFSELVLTSGVFPKNFSKAPTEFEKYPRLLIKNILKYDKEEGKDVLAGYKEWSTKMLHSAKGFYDNDKEKLAERLERIEKSIKKYEEVLARKNNLLYLKRSLFGWITEFLYPLYSLAKEINKEIVSYEVEEIDRIKESGQLEEIKNHFNNLEQDFEETFKLAKKLILNNQKYYKKIADKEEE